MLSNGAVMAGLMFLAQENCFIQPLQLHVCIVLRYQADLQWIAMDHPGLGLWSPLVKPTDITKLPSQVSSFAQAILDVLVTKLYRTDTTPQRKF